jgi:hypothetical protein
VSFGAARIVTRVGLTVSPAGSAAQRHLCRGKRRKLGCAIALYGPVWQLLLLRNAACLTLSLRARLPDLGRCRGQRLMWCQRDFVLVRLCGIGCMHLN